MMTGWTVLYGRGDRGARVEKDVGEGNRRRRGEKTDTKEVAIFGGLITGPGGGRPKRTQKEAVSNAQRRSFSSRQEDGSQSDLRAVETSRRDVGPSISGRMCAVAGLVLCLDRVQLITFGGCGETVDRRGEDQASRPKPGGRRLRLSWGRESLGRDGHGAGGLGGWGAGKNSGTLRIGKE